MICGYLGWAPGEHAYVCLRRQHRLIMESTGGIDVLTSYPHPQAPRPAPAAPAARRLQTRTHATDAVVLLTAEGALPRPTVARPLFAGEGRGELRA
jgi:hypothetical protein